MFLTNMMLTLKVQRLFYLAPKTDYKDLHLEMQMWYLYQTGISLQVGDGFHPSPVQVTPADFPEEGSEEEGDREPFRDITNT